MPRPEAMSPIGSRWAACAISMSDGSGVDVMACLCPSRCPVAVVPQSAILRCPRVPARGPGRGGGADADACVYGVPMARTKTEYRCAECGWTSPKWVGQCRECRAWGTLEEAGSPGLAVPAAAAPRRAAV
ncbi:hypothetical protein ACFQ23_10155, partial [Schaalia naturae]